MFFFLGGGAHARHPPRFWQGLEHLTDSEEEAATAGLQGSTTRAGRPGEPGRRAGPARSGTEELPGVPAEEAAASRRPPAFRRGRSRLAAGRPYPGLRGTAHRRHGVRISSALAPEPARSEAGPGASPLRGMVRPRHVGPAAAQRRRAPHVLRAVMAALLSSAGRLRALRPRLPPLLPPLLRPPAAPAAPPGPAR